MDSDFSAIWYNTKNKNYIDDLDFYLNILDKNLPVLEFGSGTGRLSLHLIANQFECYGIEINKFYKDFLESRLFEIKYDKSFHTNFDEIKTEKSRRFQIILPFNFLFYIPPNELKYFFEDLTLLKSKSVIFDTDNIVSEVTVNNFQTRKFTINDELSGFEKVLLSRNKIVVEEYLVINDKTDLLNHFELYIHNADFIFNSLAEQFNVHSLYGNFNKEHYNQFSEKIIGVIKKK